MIAFRSHDEKLLVTEAGDTGRAPRKAPVMADVAKLAGVSHQTVSRVINSSDHVKEDTVKRVLDAMRMLDYRPNPVARALATGKSKTLGVVSFNTTLYGPASTLFGIERAAHGAGYFVSIVSLLSLDRSSVLDAVERLRAQGVEESSLSPRRPSRPTPCHSCRTTSRWLPSRQGPPRVFRSSRSISSPEPSSPREHLLELGHRTVWHIAGPDDWLEAQQRIAGWRSTLESAGAPVPPVLVGDWGSKSGYELGRQLAADPEVTAVFAGNDAMALGLLRALHEAGRTPPSDVSVVGFDDCPEAAYFIPPLTTIRQDFIEVGRRALNLMLEEIESGSRSAACAPVPPELVVRESTSSPRR